MRSAHAYFLVVTCVVVTALLSTSRGATAAWSPRERQIISGLFITGDERPAKDPTNTVADDPRAAALGQRLFFDKRLSADGTVSCATCHQPDKLFTDGKVLSEGIGMATRNAPTIVGASAHTWQFWDGRADSLWAQALGPLENPSEHGFTRTQIARVVASAYRDQYETLFGNLPDFEDYLRFPERAMPGADVDLNRAWNQMTPTDQDLVNRVFANAGKAIEAYERLIRPGVSRFDRYALSVARNADESTELNDDEINGLKLFIGRAGCVGCHNSNDFSDGRFHNTGVPFGASGVNDFGRSGGLEVAGKSEFACAGVFSDAPKTCAARQVPAASAQDMRAFKTPSLRTAAATAPYMHGGQFATLKDVLRHYRSAPAAPAGVTELKALNLSDRDLNDLEAFLLSLSAPLDAAPELLRAPVEASR
jgi:cytochrome c peroxidase